LYLLLSQFSAWVSQPVFTLNERSNVALFSALLLGLIGAMAPCQLSASVGAMTYFGNRQMQNSHVSWREMIWYLVGKMTVYTSLGLLFYRMGRNFSVETAPVLGCARMLLGPLLILIGIFLLGWIRLPGVGARFSAALNQCARKWGGNSGAFLMGVAFSLGFCPTMFWLFFGLLMPLTMDVEYGLMLPPLFAVGTALPLLLFLGISYGVGRHRLPIRKARQVGRWVQRVAGVFFILLGIADMMIFWDHMLAFCAF
jgi:cytochrome c biogenesis protein CcdA